MANKKSAKVSAKVKKKTIDLTENKTSVQVNAAVTRIGKTFISLIKDCNIYYLQQIAKGLTINEYFLNEEMFSKMLGQNESLVDRYLATSVGMEVCDTIDGAIKANPEFYAGSNMSDVITLSTIIMVERDEETGKKNLVVKQIGNLSGKPLIAMPFSEFNPNRLMQVAICAQVEITNYLRKLASRYVAIANSKGRRSSHVGALRASIYDVMVKNVIPFIKTKTDSFGEVDIIRIIGDLEKPIVSFIVDRVIKLGVPAELVNEFVGKIEIHIVYDISKPKIVDSEISIIISVPGVNDENTHNVIQTLYSFILNDYISLVDPSVTKASVMDRIGKAIDDVILAVTNMIMTYTIVTYKTPAEEVNG